MVLPLGAVADCMNMVSADKVRMYEDVRIHVSDIIKSNQDTMFCPREYFLLFKKLSSNIIRKVTPCQRLLFMNGEAIHEYIREVFSKNTLYGGSVWGTWECVDCNKMLYQTYLPKVCLSCGGRSHKYHEVHLIHDRARVIGRPDFILKYDGKYYIYEVKTIDRKDLDFDDIDKPLGDHIIQASMYYWIAKELGMPVHDMIRYIYVDRSLTKLFHGSVYKELEAPPISKVRADAFFDKAQSTYFSIKDDRIPDKICKSADCSRAKNCQATSVCFSI